MVLQWLSALPCSFDQTCLSVNLAHFMHDDDFDDGDDDDFDDDDVDYGEELAIDGGRVKDVFIIN